LRRRTSRADPVAEVSIDPFGEQRDVLAEVRQDLLALGGRRGPRRWPPRLPFEGDDARFCGPAPLPKPRDRALQSPRRPMKESAQQLLN
jgi:hypothetical protein